MNASSYIGGWRTLVLALWLAMFASPAFAQDRAAGTSEGRSESRNAVTLLSFEVTPTDIRLDLEAAADVGAPRVRNEPGYVRVSFDEMTGSSLYLPGDGRAVRYIRAREGAVDNAVIVLRIGDARDLPEQAVTVTRMGRRAAITIRRDALPPTYTTAPRSVSASAASSVAGAADEEADDAARTPAPVAAEAPMAEATAADALAAEAMAADTLAADALAADALDESEMGDATAPSGAGATTGGSAGLLRSRASESERGASPGLAGGDSTGNLFSLLAITAVLLLALGTVRYWQSRRASSSLEPSIRILAAARLSSKQQLIVVRALGQDHLLSVEPGRTERLASINTPLEKSTDEVVSALRASREPGASPAGLSSLHGPLLGPASQPSAPTFLARTLTALGVGARPQPSSAAGSAFSSPEPTAAQAHANTQFSRELARLVESRSEMPLATTSMPPSEASAVAGLVRLRAQAQAGRA